MASITNAIKGSENAAEKRQKMESMFRYLDSEPKDKENVFFNLLIMTFHDKELINRNLLVSKNR